MERAQQGSRAFRHHQKAELFSSPALSLHEAEKAV